MANQMEQNIETEIDTGFAYGVYKDNVLQRRKTEQQCFRRMLGTVYHNHKRHLGPTC